MHFRRRQTISPFLRFDHHPVSYLRRAFRAAQIAHLVLGLACEANRYQLAFGRFDFHVGRVNGGDDAEHMLSAPMGGHDGGGADEEQSGDEESKECHGGVLSLMN